MKFEVIKEIKVFDWIALKVGDEIEINSDESVKLNTPFGNLELSFDSIKDSLKSKEIIQVSIIDLDDENIIKDYRLQLDVKTTRKKAREIENYLRDTIKNMI